MERIVEPELMTDDDQAEAYAAADFEEPHNRVVELFRATFPEWHDGHVLDLGCGPGDIACRFARAYPEAFVDGVDGSPAMLAEGRRRLAEEPPLLARVNLIEGLLPAPALPRPLYDAILCNSLLHHLHEPQILWDSVKRFAAPGAPVFIVDLRRPESPREARMLVEMYASKEPTVLQEDFYNSLLAAFEAEEIEDQLRQAGLPHLRVREIGDRHVMVVGTM